MLAKCSRPVSYTHLDVYKRQVDTDAICAAIKDVFEDTRAVLEPAGALAVAGAKAYAARHKLKDKTLAVSYTHLDVYKRQDQDQRGAPFG